MKAKAEKKQTGADYHIACQNCGCVNERLQMIPLRNETHVVGWLFACDDCWVKSLTEK